MPDRFLIRLTGVAMAAALAGCQMLPYPRTAEAPEEARPTRLRPVPTPPVATAELPPPGAAQVPADASLPAAEAALAGSAAESGGAQVAAAAPAPSEVEVGRTDFIGGWTLASGGESCQLHTSLTTWTGGYRASTRGCSSPTLKGVSAWNLNGGQVTLIDDTGATVARLSPSSKTQFNGQTEGGAPVSVSR
jgi:hypothetical protein